MLSISSSFEYSILKSRGKKEKGHQFPGQQHRARSDQLEIVKRNGIVINDHDVKNQDTRMMMVQTEIEVSGSLQ